MRIAGVSEARAASQPCQPGEIARTVVEQADVVGVHELGRVGDVGESEEMAELVEEDGPFLSLAVPPCRDLGERVLVERDTACREAESPVPCADRDWATDSGDITGELMDLARGRP